MNYQGLYPITQLKRVDESTKFQFVSEFKTCPILIPVLCLPKRPDKFRISIGRFPITENVIPLAVTKSHPLFSRGFTNKNNK